MKTGKAMQADSHRTQLVKFAIAYQQSGLSIIPVGQDKKPLTAWKHYQFDFRNGCRHFEFHVRHARVISLRNDPSVVRHDDKRDIGQRRVVKSSRTHRNFNRARIVRH